MANKNLNVVLYNNVVGKISQDSKGQIVFKYSDNAKHALSLSLPIIKQKTYTNKECNGYFNGLLPESDNTRNLIGKKYGINPKNDFSILNAIGYDCAGAVSFVADTQINNSEWHEISGKVLHSDELLTLIANLPKKPLLTSVDGMRLSLAGAQYKTAVVLIDNEIALPNVDVPTTHLLKPQISDLNETVENEYICLKSAQILGISTPNVEIRKVSNINYFLIERYDRQVKNNLLKRIHQEDFCQALNIASAYKYQSEGGVSINDCFKILKQTSQPAKSIASFLQVFVFNYLIGNNDAHGKNFSITHDDNGNISLAPAYDILCTQAYPELTAKMAMKIDSQYAPLKVQARHFEKIMIDNNINYTAFKKIIAHQINELPNIVTEVSKSIENNIGNTISNIVTANCNKLKDIFGLNN